MTSLAIGLAAGLAAGLGAGFGAGLAAGRLAAALFTAGRRAARGFVVVRFAVERLAPLDDRFAEAFTGDFLVERFAADLRDEDFFLAGIPILPCARAMARPRPESCTPLSG